MRVGLVCVTVVATLFSMCDDDNDDDGGGGDGDHK